VVVYGLSAIDPDDRGSQMDGVQEVAWDLVVVRGDGAALLEPGKEVFDQVVCLAQVAVTIGCTSHGPKAMTPLCRALQTQPCRANNASSAVREHTGQNRWSLR